MAKTTDYANALLLHVFNNVALTLIGDAAGLLPSAGVGSLWLGLHTADPGVGGSQTTSEAAYTGYARVAVARTAGKWVVVGNGVENVDPVAWPESSDGPETETHFSIGTDQTGTGRLLYSGALGADLVVNNQITPEVAAGDIDVTES